MIYNFFKIALRNLQKRKLHSFINIFGLALGMAATILIASYVFFELSYDKHNEKYSDIYRIYSTIYLPNGESVEGPATLGTIAPQLHEQIPEITQAIRMQGFGNMDIYYKESIFSSNKLLWVDSSFFDVFSFEFISGNPSDALTQKRSLVLTQSFAKKIFGEEDAFNKMVKVNDNSYKIAGIIKDVPLNSHLDFDILGSFITVCNSDYDITKDNGFNFYTYVVSPTLKNNRTAIEEKTNALVNQITSDRFGEMGLKVDSYFQPLGDIHLKSHSIFEFKTNGDINNIYIFSILAIFIILIAVVNFINLVTANSETRAKEIGLRKVMGAFRANLFKQFIGESILTSVCAFIVALGITELFINLFKEMMASPIVLPYWENPAILIIMLLAVILVGFLSGSYPAVYLSRYLPIEALKGSKSSGGAKNTFLRKSLVVFQFTIAIFLLINLALLYKQVSFMKNKDLGFDKEQIVVIEKISSKIRSSYTSLKANLLTNPNIISVAASQAVPGELGNIEAAYIVGSDSKSSIAIHENRIQDDFIKTFGIKLIAGEDFSKEMGTAKDKIILNETAVKRLGLEDPINKKVVFYKDTLQIIGVVQDFHFQSLHQEIAPFSMTKRRTYFSLISVKINPREISKTLKEIEEALRNVDPNNVFNYKFIDQTFEEMYLAEERSNQLTTYAAILAIIISMLGLFALTSFTITQKIQEIGVRKVMGASVQQVVKMFIIDSTKWVVIAGIIAIPLAYLSMQKWLENFSYHTSISWWMFLFGCIIALIIAIATVSFISIKAARANPANSLKYE